MACLRAVSISKNERALLVRVGDLFTQKASGFYLWNWAGSGGRAWHFHYSKSGGLQCNKRGYFNMKKLALSISKN